MPVVCSPANRKGSDFWDLRWLVLEDLLRAGGEFYQSVAARAPARRKQPAAAKKRPARTKLREREPWWASRRRGADSLKGLGNC